ncbi:MAG: helix-turn-helix transcriptional regulator [Planctomycetota bacterium]
MVSKDLVAASSRPLILSILAREESYGYAILQEVKRLSGGELNWTDGMLYPVLHRLERDGLVQSSWRTPESGRRRRYYRLTGPGGRALEVERRDWLAVHRTLTLAWRTTPCSSWSL